MQLVDVQSRRDRSGITSGALIAGAIVVVINALFVLNNLGPYLGTFHFGPMYMFSDLSETGDNHFFLPRVSLSDDFAYVKVAEYDPRGVETPAAREFKWFLSLVDERNTLVNMNFVRYHVSQICASAPDVSIELRLRTVDGERIGFNNACQEPSMRRYAPLASYKACAPRNCDALTKAWAMRVLAER